MASPWVERNNNYAQYPQSRGSQYEGPNASVCACAHCHVLTIGVFCETCWITCYDRGYADGRAHQDLSIHHEELAQARERNYHLSHRDGPLQNDCRFCLDAIA